MDFYKLLGLNRAASVDEVERAYRRLARRYHPGINPGDRVAEDMYRQIRRQFAAEVTVGGVQHQCYLDLVLLELTSQPENLPLNRPARE